MTGEYKHSIDSKGRLFIPAKLRDELGDVFYITLSMDDCLSVYSAESWREFSDKVNAMSYAKQRKMRPLLRMRQGASLTIRGARLFRRICVSMLISAKASLSSAAITMPRYGTRRAGAGFPKAR